MFGSGLEGHLASLDLVLDRLGGDRSLNVVLISALEKNVLSFCGAVVEIIVGERPRQRVEQARLNRRRTASLQTRGAANQHRVGGAEGHDKQGESHRVRE